MSSERPGWNMRPSMILMLRRMAKTLGETPRSSTLASVPVERNGIGAIRTASCVSNGPSGPRAMPGASWMTFTESIGTPLVISDSPQRGNDAHAHGANPRQQAADNAHNECKPQAKRQKRLGKDKRRQETGKSQADNRDGQVSESQTE